MLSTNKALHHLQEITAPQAPWRCTQFMIPSTLLPLLKVARGALSELAASLYYCEPAVGGKTQGKIF